MTISLRPVFAIFPLYLSIAAFAAPNYPFPQHSAYASGTLHPTVRTQAQQDGDVKAAYDHWKTNYVAQAGAELDGRKRSRILFSKKKSDVTVSEGQGYGMLIVPLMAGYDPDAQAIFDGLFEYFNDHRSSINHGLMDWHVPADESDDGDNDSAFDGDADVAMGLLLADKQWGSGGKIDYLARAKEVIAAIKGGEIGAASRLPLLGDWVGVGSTSGKHNQYTWRSSDVMVSHFRCYRAAMGDAAWDAVIANCLSGFTYLQEHYSPATGLLPDFMVPVSAADHNPKPAPHGFLEDNDESYAYNACRDPWRIGVDAALTGDAASKAQAKKLSDWARTSTGGDASQIRAGYKLDGTPLAGSDYFTTAFASPLGVGAMVSGNQAWLNSIYGAVYKVRESYYEDSINTICLIVMTGNYWDTNIIRTGTETGAYAAAAPAAN